MKKLLYALLIAVGFFVAAPAFAMLGYQGENPTTIQNLQPASQKVQPINNTNRFGHRGENPTTNRFGHRGENPNAKNWKQNHKGVRAYSRLAAQ